MKNIRVYLSENFQFLEAKIFSLYLNKRVFVMENKVSDQTTVNTLADLAYLRNRFCM